MVSVSDLKNVQTLFPNAQVSYISPPTAGSLQYLNIRVTERLHRYRLLKRQWNDVVQPATEKNLSVSKTKSASPTSDDVPTAMKRSDQRTALKLEPLRLQIEQDILQLRKMIRTREKKLVENARLRTAINHRSNRIKTCVITTPNDPVTISRTVTTQHSVSSKHVKTFDDVQIPGPRVRSAIFPQNALTDSGVVMISNPPSRFSSNSHQQGKLKQQIQTAAFNICGYRVSPPLRSKSPPSFHPRTIRTTASRQTPSLHTLVPSLGKEKQADRNKSESVSPSSNSSTDSNETSDRQYTYAASTSSAIPRSIKFHRDTSLLSVLIASKSSTITHDQEPDYEQSLLYEKPIISLQPRHNHDSYDMFFSQLDRLRVTMPRTNVYNSYTRNV